MPVCSGPGPPGERREHLEGESRSSRSAHPAVAPSSASGGAHLSTRGGARAHPARHCWHPRAGHSLRFSHHVCALLGVHQRLLARWRFAHLVPLRPRRHAVLRQSSERTLVACDVDCFAVRRLRPSGGAAAAHADSIGRLVRALCPGARAVEEPLGSPACGDCVQLHQRPPVQRRAHGFHQRLLHLPVGFLGHRARRPGHPVVAAGARGSACLAGGERLPGCRAAEPALVWRVGGLAACRALRRLGCSSAVPQGGWAGLGDGCALVGGILAAHRETSAGFRP